ncbi:hypothetical protein [Chelativorans sp. Marseille-P2723]|uniref:hypothetical protein n=1 Tax=Chelativorans sp. Marseille-P2723 TaxID=2709133 RepID=UPI00156FB239|nr:hypothetical protein [Chelativorans sp. Marseille-P2723]
MTVEDIMREEREQTLSELDRLPLPEAAKADVLAFCASVQEAINQVVASLDRPIDQRVVPAALALMRDEMERLNRRFVEAALAAPLQ